MLDLVIRGGVVVDGTGAPRQRADVGVRDGQIVEVGQIGEAARRSIDADGRIVAPGFIDVHTHLDAQLFWDPLGSPSSDHGVTTVLGGNCGFSIAPLSDADAEFVTKMLARVEGMPLGALQNGVPWNWHTTEEFLACLEGRLAVNAGFMVGHSTVRRFVMGEAASERSATPDELLVMEGLVRDGLAAGALGFSSTRAQTHLDHNGVGVPSRHATDEELIRLAGLCRDFPGTSLEFIPFVGPEFPHAAVELMARMSAEAQRPLNWNLLQPTAANLDICHGKLAASDYARALGGRVVGLALPMQIPLRLNFLSGFILDSLPGWDQVMALPVPEKLAVLSDPAQRRRLDELARSDAGQAHLADWAGRQIVQTFAPDLRHYEGRTVDDIAKAAGKAPFDALLDIVCADDLRTTFLLPRDDQPGDWEARVGVLRDERVVVGGSDAGAHLDILGTFNYPTYLLAHAVREEQLMTTEEVVQLLTQAPSRLYGLHDRGVLAPGMRADIVVFDEATVGTEELRTNFDLPTGAGRLYAGSIGMHDVVVNGEPIIQDGAPTGARPGSVLRAGLDTRTPVLAG